ncbi:ferritin [Thermosyntropha sp.]|uniref:ferritin n=1 Tax=Thermosyntropha sp. TaxID=2740820 RepID=UPI0025DD2932|nr:ferritin [Thermosyntropha sp.]MBO8159250.1 ferritin [Thermosyntropha sp.]
MVSERLRAKLNEQIQKEFYSAYLYLSMEAYFLSQNLDGFANWFHIQAQEERDHAMLIFDYLNRVGAKIELGAIEAPPTDFASPEEVLQKTVEHERLVTRSIYDLFDLASEEKDHKTVMFLQWFVNEQVEEEENAEKNLASFRFVKDDPKGILLLDREMAARVYTPITSTNSQQ